MPSMLIVSINRYGGGAPACVCVQLSMRVPFTRAGIECAILVRPMHRGMHGLREVFGYDGSIGL